MSRTIYHAWPLGKVILTQHFARGRNATKLRDRVEFA